MAVGSRSLTGVGALPRGSLKRLIKAMLSPVHRWMFPYKKMFKLLDRNARARKYGSTEFVANLTWLNVPKDRWIPERDFDSLCKVKFEGSEFNAIPHWDDYLKGLYGDYMMLPSPEKRVGHTYQIVKSVEIGEDKIDSELR